MGHALTSAAEEAKKRVQEKWPDARTYQASSTDLWGISGDGIEVGRYKGYWYEGDAWLDADRRMRNDEM